MKYLLWAVINVIFLALLYSWLVLGNQFTGNIIVFYIWLHFISGCCLLCIKETRKEVLKCTPNAPLLLNFSFDLSISFALASFGHFLYAGMYLFTSFIILDLFKRGE